MFTDKEEAYEKQRVRMFWTSRWRYKTISAWEANLFGRWQYRSVVKGKIYEIFKDALIKMIFEKRLTKDEASSLFEMIKGNDKESLYLALTIMKQKKKSIFLKK